jgi:surface protein
MDTTRAFSILALLLMTHLLATMAQTEPLTDANIRGAVDAWFTECVPGQPADGISCDHASTRQKYGDISNWNTATVTHMSRDTDANDGLFEDKPNFNADISRWNTASVTYMAGMFACCNRAKLPFDNLEATSFTGNIDSWNTASVITMERMFAGVRRDDQSFNQPIGSWNVASVTSMYVVNIINLNWIYL